MSVDPNSISDYLKSRGAIASFDARRRLWGYHNPAERYAGSARQNTELLQSLRFADSAPYLVLKGPTTRSPGDSIEATLEGNYPARIITWTTTAPAEVQPGETITLGPVNYNGFFPVKIQTLDFSTTKLEVPGAVFAVPADSGQLDVRIWGTPTEYGTLPTPVAPDAGDENLMERFWTNLNVNEDLFVQVLGGVRDDFLTADKLYGLGLDLGFGVIVTLATGGLPAVELYWIPTGINFGFDLVYTILDKLVEQVPNLSDADRLRLRQIFALPVGVGKVVIDWKDFRKSTKQVCRTLELFQAVPETVAFKVGKIDHEDGKGKLAGSMFRDSVSKSIGMVCKVWK